MKRVVTLLLVLTLAITCLPVSAFAKAKQMNDGVPVWTEETVRQYALDYIEGKSMSRLWGYYDLQIRRYMPMATYEALLIDLEWMTGAFLELGSYRSFSEPELKLKTHVLHLCMEKQDLDLYFTHKDKEDDWEVMAVEFVPAKEELTSNGVDMLVDGGVRDSAVADYTVQEITLGNEYPLGGILTMPNEATADTPVPACVFVHDFDVWDRDGTLGETKLFADLAQSLANMGIASLRYDKRAFTYPDAVFETVHGDVVEDAVFAGELLKQNPLVDTQRIVLIGHGLGAVLAPRIVAEANDLYTAMILIGGQPDSLLELTYQREKDSLSELSKEELQTVQNAVRKMGEMKEAKARELTLFGRNGYYYWDAVHNDALKLLRTLRLPTYIVQGKRDPIVSEDDGRRAYAEKLGDGQSYLDFKAFRGLNHLLMNDLSVGADGKPEYKVEAHLDIQAGRNLSQWILNLYQNDEE